MPDQDIVEKLTSSDYFNNTYKKILIELDALAQGVFDETEAENVAAQCLIAQAGLIKILSRAEQHSRGLKRDIDFAKADAYHGLRQQKVDGKKLAEAALAQLILKDSKVNELYKEQNDAERESRELANLLNILKDAHLTFRMLVKKGG